METIERVNGIPVRTLGKTGVKVTVLGIGGYHIGKLSDRREGIGIIRTAVDEGVNFLDNAWCYNRGRSEETMGDALQDGYREKVFLMTKNHGRDKLTFQRQLDDSLRKFQTDHIDLLQFHEIIHEGEPEQIFTQGAIEEAIEAREAGKIRFIGFTGHRWPHLLQEMLAKDFSWDTIQFPTNLLDAHFRSFTKQILPAVQKRGIGIIGMKSLAGGQMLKTEISPEEAITYALSLPIDTLVSGMDSLEVLTRNLKIVRSWRPLSEDKRNTLLKKIASFAGDGHLERYKTD